MTDSQQTTIAIHGMSCPHCTARVKDALESVDGVAGAEVDLDAGQATVTLNGSVSREQLVDAVSEAGYEVPAAA